VVIARVGAHRYCVVAKAALMAAVTLDWSAAIDDLVTFWCYSSSDNRVEIERGMPHVIAWYLAASVFRSSSYVLTYDSLQHSSYVFVTKVSAPLDLIQAGKTVFLSSEQAPSVRLSWEDRSWNPVTSGFLLTGG
jgi:hypothetical protein